MEIAPVVDAAAEAQRREKNKKLANRFLRVRRRSIRDTSNPFLLNENFFKKQYRFDKHLAFMLIQLLHNSLCGVRSTKIPVHLQVLAALRFYGEGSLQKGVAADFGHPVGQSTISEIITKVTDCLNELADWYIRFPSTPEERQSISHEFQGKIRIPGILGLIDCFKVCMWRPVKHEEAYFNFEYGTCMNVQAIVDSKYVIQNLRVCPGSNTDQFIWNHSRVKHKLELLRENNNVLDQEGPYFFVADSGYFSSPILLTTVNQAAEHTPEYIYNSDIRSVRSTVERTFGVQSNQWRCISRSRKMCYQPKKVAKIIKASAKLHNFRLLRGVPYENVPQNPIMANQAIILHNNDDYYNGLVIRQRLINRFYNN